MLTKENMKDEIIRTLNSNTDFLFIELFAMDVLNDYFITKMNQMKKPELEELYNKSLGYKNDLQNE